MKVRLAEITDLYPGMFGKLLIPAGSRETVFVPSRAVQQVGQLTTVLARTDRGWERRFVRTGAQEENRVEILSGLEGGEELGITGGRI